MTSLQDGTTDLIHFPRKSILSPAEASQYLGIRKYHLFIMRILRCGPPTISINKKTLYKEDELGKFRLFLMESMGICENNGIYKEKTDKIRKNIHDPLMSLLSINIIKRKFILVTLWSMVLFGISINLLLF
ncbi:hypothetical protein F1645_03260 [Novacetimonas hansenii]|uniref:Uncharacterized protein n=1 Tax=Novacetimonas hansenii ATCC 23769 TaxID=714995 RepID=D5QF56_NOVHA|nr:hypothetical protein GXY_08859 [Novacetimonas hansenii ATCC 23769]